MHRGIVSALQRGERGAQRGSVRFLDPKEMYKQRMEAQKQLDEVRGVGSGSRIGSAQSLLLSPLKSPLTSASHFCTTLFQAKAKIWDLIDELDDSVKIKDYYSALLDPIAMNRVANRHIKVRGCLCARLCPSKCCIPLDSPPPAYRARALNLKSLHP